VVASGASPWPAGYRPRGSAFGLVPFSFRVLVRATRSATCMALGWMPTVRASLVHGPRVGRSTDGGEGKGNCGWWASGSGAASPGKACLGVWGIFPRGRVEQITACLQRRGLFRCVEIKSKGYRCPYPPASPEPRRCARRRPPLPASLPSNGHPAGRGIASAGAFLDRVSVQSPAGGPASPSGVRGFLQTACAAAGESISPPSVKSLTSIFRGIVGG
jgi:hypothetical protein